MLQFDSLFAFLSNGLLSRRIEPTFREGRLEKEQKEEEEEKEEELVIVEMVYSGYGGGKGGKETGNNELKGKVHGNCSNCVLISFCVPCK